MDQKQLKMSEVAMGALQERFQDDMIAVLKNIADPNTDPKKARKIQINVKVIPNGNRGLATLEFATKTTLMPAESFSTEIVFEKDQSGLIAVSEFRTGTIPGQTNIDQYIEIEGKTVDTESGEIMEQQPINKIRRIGGAR